MANGSKNEGLEQAAAAALRLFEQSEALLSWEWDGRFGAALAVIKAPQDEQVLGMIQTIFSLAMDHQTVGQAPASVQEAAKSWGGLRGDQRLFVLDPAADPLLFAAWWPWGGATTFSLRVGCKAQSDQIAQAEILTALRGWFSL